MPASTFGSGISSRTVGSRKPAAVLHLDAAAREDAREKLGQVVALRDRKRARRAALVEPVAPSAPGGGVLDAEERAIHGRDMSATRGGAVEAFAALVAHLVVRSAVSSGVKPDPRSQRGMDCA